jgi:hypothetical protein
VSSPYPPFRKYSKLQAKQCIRLSCNHTIGQLIIKELLVTRANRYILIGHDSNQAKMINDKRGYIKDHQGSWQTSLDNYTCHAGLNRISKKVQLKETRKLHCYDIMWAKIVFAK